MAKPDTQGVVADMTSASACVGKGKASLLVTVFKSGTGTIGGGGAVTITDSAVLATSKIILTNTSGVRALRVGPVAAGSFVVIGKAADTFNYLVVNGI